jgi:hypothetical protein
MKDAQEMADKDVPEATPEYHPELDCLGACLRFANT